LTLSASIILRDPKCAMVALVPLKKNKLVGFQADETMHGRVKESARLRGFDTYADWMRQLVSAALESDAAVPRNVDPEILVKIATVNSGYLAETLAGQLKERKADQPKLLNGLLVQLQEAFACGAKAEEVTCATITPSGKN